ncbi:MAG: hypothetical protein KJO43_02460 [Phycisphaerae bacterium]|nr:hypothetical protein [Phycisphaerae bacterium]NNF42971.1 deiodinase [Phycisphaerales bacterium]
MRTRFADHADFLTIYIKEAHPEDEWQMGVNEDEGVCYMQPTTLAERVAIAGDFVRETDFEIPLVVDGMDNAAEMAFAAWPERLYVIGEDGRVAYKGGMGPMDFDPDELESWLEQRFP